MRGRGDDGDLSVTGAARPRAAAVNEGERLPGLPFPAVLFQSAAFLAARMVRVRRQAATRV